ncbi:MAG: acetyl-CoA carboxylase biotin carboxyl carrier protein [Deltaproteobacteria bacterium]|nr:acetyl-CoA carboxylase biotin carboxyl carrier protein [Deltaproteobacteria bacterium]
MDVDKLKAILSALEGTDVTLIDWTVGEERIKLQLGHAPVSAPVLSAPMPAPVMHAPPPAPVHTPAPPVAMKPQQKPGFTVNSPFVGTFYRSPSPEAPSFADVGTIVKKGQVLCIVEAMKLMNEIEAEQGGRVVEVLVPNGAPVEYGEPLFRLEPV